MARIKDPLEWLKNMDMNQYNIVVDWFTKKAEKAFENANIKAFDKEYNSFEDILYMFDKIMVIEIAPTTQDLTNHAFERYNTIMSVKGDLRELCRDFLNDKLEYCKSVTL